MYGLQPQPMYVQEGCLCSVQAQQSLASARSSRNAGRQQGAPLVQPAPASTHWHQQWTGAQKWAGVDPTPGLLMMQTEKRHATAAAVALTPAA